MIQLRNTMVGLACLVLAGCTGLSELRTPVAQFGVATQAAASTEDDYLDALRASDQKASYYANARAYVVDRQTPQLLASNTRTIPDADLQLRKALLDSLKAYGAKMAALASPDPNTALDKNATDLAKNLNTLDATVAKQVPPGAPSSDQVVAAIVAIANFVLDQERAGKIQEAARDMQTPITTVVDTLKAENLDFAQKFDTNIAQVGSSMLAILTDATQKESGNVAARALLYREYSSDYQSFSTAHDAAPINEALDALAKANFAIANAQGSGIEAAVAEFVKRVEDARAFYQGLQK